MNSELQKYFRASKRIRIHEREGVFIVVDDKEEAVELIKRLFNSRGEIFEIVSAKNVSEAKKRIEEYGNGDKVKAIVIDLGLEGEGKNADGFSLAKYLDQEHQDIPYIVSTGRVKRAKQIENMLPGVDVFIKGENSINDLAESLGLNVAKGKSSTDVIPKDNNTEELKTGGILSNLFKKVLLFQLF